LIWIKGTAMRLMPKRVKFRKTHRGKIKKWY
jgi:hypothetical protein